MNIIKNKNIYFAISLALLVIGMAPLFIYGLRLGIDFTGGSKLDLQSQKTLSRNEISEVLENLQYEGFKVQEVGEKAVSITTKPIDQKQKNQIVTELKKKDTTIAETSFETVGPTVGEETRNNALTAVLIASIAIALYIAWAFREVSKPVASWKFGITAIIALVHDTLITIGIFALFGYFFGAEVDSLFITAILTIMGFSVHDTIVVFDRIRENLKKNQKESFDNIVNNSVLETFNRSLNTSLTVVIVLFCMLLFGGESIRWFVATLLVGIVVGTYSSIFTASPILAVWNQMKGNQAVTKK
jgi:preprotein translocase subunit SecF